MLSLRYASPLASPSLSQRNCCWSNRHAALRHLRCKDSFVAESIVVGTSIITIAARFGYIAFFDNHVEGADYEEEDELGLTTWSLATTISYLPFLGFIAFALPIIKSQQSSLVQPPHNTSSSNPPPFTFLGLGGRSSYYLYLLILYSLPLTALNGFSWDATSLIMWVLCCFQMQIEAILATGVTPSLLEATRAARSLVDKPSDLKDRPSLIPYLKDRPSLIPSRRSKDRSWRNDEADRSNDSGSYSSRDEEEEVQLRQFDRLLLERSRVKESLNKLKLAVEAAGFTLDEGWRAEIKQVNGRYRTNYLPPASFEKRQLQSSIARESRSRESRSSSLQLGYSTVPSVVKAYIDLANYR